MYVQLCSYLICFDLLKTMKAGGVFGVLVLMGALAGVSAWGIQKATMPSNVRLGLEVYIKFYQSDGTIGWLTNTSGKPAIVSSKSSAQVFELVANDSTDSSETPTLKYNGTKFKIKDKYTQTYFYITCADRGSTQVSFSETDSVPLACKQILEESGEIVEGWSDTVVKFSQKLALSFQNNDCSQIAGCSYCAGLGTYTSGDTELTNLNVCCNASQGPVAWSFERP